MTSPWRGPRPGPLLRSRQVPSMAWSSAPTHALVPAALRKIDLATGDATDLMALQLVDHLGEAAGLPQESLRAMRANLAAFKRRRELGLEKMQLPNEFICPITQDKMKGGLAHGPMSLP